MQYAHRDWQSELAHSISIVGIPQVSRAVATKAINWVRSPTLGPGRREYAVTPLLREWLESNVGACGEMWQYEKSNTFYMEFLFANKNDAMRFKLTWG